MKKSHKIIYWASTIWLSFGMAYTGILQFMKTQMEIDLMTKLGYPIYFLTIIGVWKILGVIAVLIPKFPVVKEWAYAGFFFAMSGAFASHIAVGSTPTELIGPTLLLVLTIVSWCFRSAGRKIAKVD